jgi:hypothetical protein
MSVRQNVFRQVVFWQVVFRQSVFRQTVRPSSYAVRSHVNRQCFYERSFILSCVASDSIKCHLIINVRFETRAYEVFYVEHNLTIHTIVNLYIRDQLKEDYFFVDVSVRLKQWHLSTLDFCCWLSTFCYRLSTFYFRLSTFSTRLSTFSTRPSTFRYTRFPVVIVWFLISIDLYIVVVGLMGQRRSDENVVKIAFCPLCTLQ